MLLLLLQAKGSRVGTFTQLRAAATLPTLFLAVLSWPSRCYGISICFFRNASTATTTVVPIAGDAVSG